MAALLGVLVYLENLMSLQWADVGLYLEIV